MDYHEIGESFEYAGYVFVVKKAPKGLMDVCTKCGFNGFCDRKDIKCTPSTRKDKQNVIFENLGMDITKFMEQKTEIKVEGTDKTFATQVTNIQSDEEIYGSLLDKLFTTYKAKNHDYSNAFSEMFDELGIDYAYGKLREKINRIKVLRKHPNMVENEGLEDALLDTAGYAILTLVELKKRKNG